MVDYLLRNKDWLFSGAGIAIIGVIYALLRNFVLKKRPKPLKELPSVAPHAIQEMTNPSRGLTVKSITDEINSAPPYQKDDVANNFKGIDVKWEGTFWDIAKPLFSKPGSSDVDVEVHPGESLHSIRFTVSVDKYPQLKILRRGDRIGVSGTIKNCSGPGIYVSLDVDAIAFAK